MDIPECANNRAQCFSLPPAAKLLWCHSDLTYTLICVYLLLFCLFLAPNGTPKPVLVITFRSVGRPDVFPANHWRDTQMYVVKGTFNLTQKNPKTNQEHSYIQTVVGWQAEKVCFYSEGNVALTSHYHFCLTRNPSELSGVSQSCLLSPVFAESQNSKWGCSHHPGVNTLVPSHSLM